MTAPPNGPDEEAAWNVLTGTQRALFHHPVATQAIFSALVAEGRRFAQTPEGAALRDLLGRSELMHRARIFWEIVTMNTFEESPEGPLPSALLEALARVVADAGLELKAARLAGELDV